ncbi:MAG TPA: hypothetical protein VMV86_06750 [Methanosarcinales archaeon]|nr:hypothetical protein [Methanosarcinales archaeon]
MIERYWPNLSEREIMGASGVTKWLPIEELKHGYLYRIIARNGLVGIWDSTRKSFWLSRIKFGDNFITDEEHWDYNNGCAKPVYEIERAKIIYEYRGENELKVLEYLNKEEKKIDDLPEEQRYRPEWFK